MLSSDPRHHNGWLPSSRAIYNAFLAGLLKSAVGRLRKSSQHVQAVEAFKKAIEADPTMVDLFSDMFLQASSENQITSFELLLHELDVAVSKPPGIVKVPGAHAQPIGVPIYLLLDFLINTSAAYTLFTMDKFNVAMKALLDSWGQYLTTPASNSTLTDKFDGWFGPEGTELLQANDRGTFNSTYITPDPTAINRGYASWDAFFTREFQPTARPIVPATPGTVIYNACESTAERYVSGVQLHNKFWLKGMAYSLYNMLGGDDQALATATKFAGGTVYQAFLSPQDYHRWHSPIAGIVTETRVIQGTYYAALPDDGDDGDMRGAIIRSQPWLTVAATRAVITIQASNQIGLVAFIGVGMVEVSTCHITVKKGDSVQPGDELGMFHFGGSSHAVIFGPHVNIKFRDQVKPGAHLKVNTIIGDVTPNFSVGIVN
ncbi:phosphatidylserine decarboxylase [Rhizoctonia solani AG-1 IB]|uniref:Phosphatidylserine decarboxylase n=2 Tax=Rhizoctonia solani TaxID=456999 RepID=M5C6I7_THACB|nr:unnamed protein product [Rhizoctonia solani]CCO34934.1 phosphatidylserine decarboxylase [Rhizoctonia solani AG-1 IB]CEL61300.1 phosphatidylserine decarboxylase [Rhizoctonia solani AG-1 IB]